MIINARYGPEAEGRLRFAVGTDVRHVEAAIKEFDELLFLALGGLGAVLLLTVLGLITFGMAPFSRLAQAMREVRAGAALSVEGKHRVTFLTSATHVIQPVTLSEPAAAR